MADETVHPTFSVDTHLFRELGELLVGRESTALVELIKNAYDADAKEVVVFGEALDDVERGYIALRDNGTGMSRAEFENGFLRIASRTKDTGERRSPLFARRYTGAKGVGRLAAHKLARVVEVASLRWDGTDPGKKALRATTGVEAAIRWDIVEQHTTLDSLKGSNAITVKEVSPPASATAGTTVTLSRLRRAWTKASHARFLEEVQTFDTPRVLAEPLPRSVLPEILLFDRPIVQDSRDTRGKVFQVKLEGALAPPDDFWEAKVEAASWVIEIDADQTTGKVRYGIAPTVATKKELPAAQLQVLSVAHPSPSEGPFFQARILLRTGRAWGGNANGIRVFMESFRVLPYGEPRNDWLSIDRDATQRDKGFLAQVDEAVAELFKDEDQRKDVGLIFVPNKHYFGAVFLTQERARSLKMLVNREGFVPDAAYETLVTLVRAGIDLATRARAAASETKRAERRAKRARDGSKNHNELAPSTGLIRAGVARAHASVAEARLLVAAGDVHGAEAKLKQAVVDVEELEAITSEVMAETAILRVLASVGTQMAAFIHEINGLVGTAEAVDRAIRRLRDSKSAKPTAREQKEAFTNLSRVVVDLRRNLERQASYLTDVVSPDARRRRSRQKLAERFDSGARLVAHIAESKGIHMENGIPATLMSPPMFPAELTTVFSNLLTNAVKAAGEGGRVHASARRSPGRIELRVENTGVAVDPKSGEKWFRPFESSTTTVDAVLGQGMGLGLPITRSVLAEYGATIGFVEPSAGFQTAVEIVFPI